MEEFLLPRQKLAASKKNEKWGKSNIDALEALLASTSYNNRSSIENKLINYELYNGRLNREDFEYVLNPYGLTDNTMPAEFQHYDIISARLNLLIGEEIKRPFNYQVVAKNSDMISSKLEKKKQMYWEALLDGEVDEERVKEIEHLARYSMKDRKEILSQAILDYLQWEQNLNLKFVEGFKDALIAGEEIYWVGKIGNKPVVRSVNPKNIHLLMTDDTEDISEAYGAIEERYMSASDILDEFWDELSEDDVRKIEEMAGRRTSSDGTGEIMPADPGYMQFLGTGDSLRSAMSSSRVSGTGIRVIKCEWKSMQKIGLLTIVNLQTGEVESEVVNEYFEVPEDSEDVLIDGDKHKEWIDETLGIYYKIHFNWISEVWEGVKIGEEVYVNIRPKAVQNRTTDNLSDCKLGYRGRIYSSRNSTSVSLIDRCKAYQYLYDIIHYRLELMLANSKGKVMLMDMAQIPSDWDLEKWMHYLSSMNIAFINSAEEGRQQTNFNQFQALDLETGRYLNNYVQMLEVLDAKMGELVGVSRQRLGQISNSELVGNVERAVTQSSHVTEYYFFIHNEVKRDVLQALIETAKDCYRVGDRIQYIADDLSQVYLEFDSDISDIDAGVFITNSSKDQQNLEVLKQLSQQAVASGLVSLSDVAGMLTTQSMSKIKHELKEGELRKEQLEQAMNDQQSQLQQMQIESNERTSAMAMEDRQAERDLKDLMNLRDNETKISIELMRMEADYMNQQPEMGEDPGKLALEKEKLSNDKDKSGKELAQKAREHEDKMRLEREKLQQQREESRQQMKAQLEATRLQRKEMEQKIKDSEHQKRVDKEKLENERRKIAVQKIKKKSSPSK